MSSGDFYLTLMSHDWLSCSRRFEFQSVSALNSWQTPSFAPNPYCFFSSHRKHFFSCLNVQRWPWKRNCVSSEMPICVLFLLFDQWQARTVLSPGDSSWIHGRKWAVTLHTIHQPCCIRVVLPHHIFQTSRVSGIVWALAIEGWVSSATYCFQHFRYPYPGLKLFAQAKWQPKELTHSCINSPA